jgi:CRP-like cAMP-binding protein
MWRFRGLATDGGTAVHAARATVVKSCFCFISQNSDHDVLNRISLVDYAWRVQVIQQSEQGDYFYVIKDGSFEVSHLTVDLSCHWHMHSGH